MFPMDLVNSILKRMNYGGNSIRNRTIYTNTYSWFTFYVLWINFILGCIYMYLSEYKNVALMLLDGVIFVAMWQGLLKYVYSRKQDVRLNSLIDIVDYKFWSPKFLKKDEYNQIINKYHLLAIIKLILEILFMSAFMLTIAQCLMANENFVINIWLPEIIKKEAIKTPYRQIICFVQVLITTHLGLTLLVQFDAIFIVLLGVCLVEMRKLNIKLRRIGVEEYGKNDFETLMECVAHHNLLLDFLNEIENIFSPLVLQMLGTNMIADIISLAGFMIAENLYKQVAFAVIIAMVTLQFFMYCLLGQIVQDETISVAIAAYDCEWESVRDLRVRHGLVLIIQRSHKFCTISMGGFLILSLENFTKIARMVMSTLTLFMNTRNT